jgi:hypothetical protein
LYTDTFELQFYFVEKKNDFNFCLIIYIIFNGRPRQYFLLFVHFIFYFFQSCMLVPLDLNACSVLFLSHFKFIILISVSSFFSFKNPNYFIFDLFQIISLLSDSLENPWNLNFKNKRSTVFPKTNQYQVMNSKKWLIIFLIWFYNNKLSNIFLF